jgi:hypothetical protein
MNWHFRELAMGEKPRDPIQGEFFASEAFNAQSMTRLITSH